MAQQIRQARLFAAEDYMAVYDSYLNSDFQAFDFKTIRDSMVSYIKSQYPENFNDWIESSDFVALLDVVAQFGHNFAFRNDLNSRNNFLATAQKQDSVFKLAEFLGYKPRRTVPANGQLKITSIKTNEVVVGSLGSSLAGKEIKFETSNNASNLDDFISIMNAVLSTTNQFGNPRKSATISGVDNQFYNLNNTENQIVFEFTGSVQGQKSTFNLIGLDYSTALRSTVEMYPDPNGSFSINYRNDNRGLGSAETGFFVGFKQGAMSFKDFSITDPISNLALDINSNHVNNDDVWVQTIDQTGAVTAHWDRVENVHGFNEIYNDIDVTKRNVFAVKTRTDGQISVLFPDEHFGNLPRGIIRIWYRTGVNQTYVLRPDDIGTKKINIKYTGVDGNIYTATIGVALQTTITNASKSETLDDIKQNAPLVYSAQDRMITASDYNNYLLTQSDQIAKIKSINRTHSGHSRFIDLMDPTGTYTNVTLYNTDGALTKTETIVESNTNNIPAQSIFDNYIKTQLENSELANLYYDRFADRFQIERNEDLDVYRWQVVDSTTGYFVNSANQIVGNTGTAADSDFMRFIKAGAMVQLSDGTTSKWARVANVFANGFGVDSSTGNSTGLTSTGSGAITLDTFVESNTTLEMAYPALPRSFTTSERSEIIGRIIDNDDFIIWYDFEAEQFKTTIGSQLIPAQLPDTTFPTTFGKNSDSWLIYATPNVTNNSYNITTRIVRYSLNSDKVHFSNSSNEYKLDYYTKKKFRDQVMFTENGVTYGKFFIAGYNFQSNGIFDSNNVTVTLVDANADGRPDDPHAYINLATQNPTLSDLRFEWTHIPDTNELIDPSFTNLIDVFVLTRSYDTEFRSWLIKNDSILADMPLAPTLNELSSQFRGLSSKKSLSDSLIYRPVKYKVLFGNKAHEELRAGFSVIRAQGSRMTDNEIKSVIVDKVYEFFHISNWEFGETFYFTELAAYVHQELAGEISSFVVVPESANSVFGKLFQITPLNDELLIPDVSVADIEIVEKITNTNIKSNG